MKDRLAIAIGITAFVAVIVGLILGAWIAYGHAEQQAERMMTEIRSLKARTEALGEEIKALSERVARAKVYVWTRVVASYYGADHLGRTVREHGRDTASGERFDAFGYTFASPYLKFGTLALFEYQGKVTAGICTDRGPHQRLRRDVDISYRMAHELGILFDGVVPLNMTIVGWSPIGAARVEVMILGEEGL